MLNWEGFAGCERGFEILQITFFLFVDNLLMIGYKTRSNRLPEYGKVRKQLDHIWTWSKDDGYEVYVLGHDDFAVAIGMWAGIR